MAKIEEDITDIKVSLGKIEEHLKNINGTVARHTKHINEICPIKHKEIDKLIYKSIGVFSVIVFLINVFVLIYVK